jgi:hypothetical protein
MGRGMEEGLKERSGEEEIRGWGKHDDEGKGDRGQRDN